MNWDPPAVCGNGHVLADVGAKVSWGPCPCSKAVPQPLGHTEMVCLACGWMYRENGCDRLVDGRPV